MITLIRFGKKIYNPKKNTKKQIEDFAKELRTIPAVVEVSFNLYVAHYILYRFQKAIKDQKVKGKSMKSIYKPLTEAYRKTKPYGTKGKFWINTGELVETLGVYVTKSKGIRYTHIGWRGNTRWRKDQKKVSLRDNILWLENRRPLIKPIVESAKSNTTWLWKRYKRLIRDNQELLKELHH